MRLFKTIEPYQIKQEANALKALSENKSDIMFFSTVEAIKKNDFCGARKLLQNLAYEDMENPKVYNLLGISYEKEGNRLKAIKFYRVAYYMNQSFTAASENLDRVSDFWYKGVADISWGINFKEAQK